MDPCRGCPVPLGWKTDCLWTHCIHLRICVHVCRGSRGEAGCTGQVRIISCGRSGQCALALRQERANSESIKLAGAMHTEGRLHPRCAERALTAHTLSGFFIGTQATAQSSALNTTNGKRGNGIFICLSSSGGLLLLIMHWNTGPHLACVPFLTWTSADMRCMPLNKCRTIFCGEAATLKSTP